MFETKNCSILLKKFDQVNHAETMNWAHFITAVNQLRSICKHHNIKYDLHLSVSFLFSNISTFHVGGNILWFPRNVFIGMTRAGFVHVNRRYQYPGLMTCRGAVVYPGIMWTGPNTKRLMWACGKWDLEALPASPAKLWPPDIVRYPRYPGANGAERRSGRKSGARVLIPPGYLHPGKETH
jgi:hypothetical protein